MEDSHINKDDVMKMLLSIDDFENIRMIRLRPLAQHNPNIIDKTTVQHEHGGFIGLNSNLGKRRFKVFKSRKKAPEPSEIIPSPKPKTHRRRRGRPSTVVTSEEDDTDESSSSSSDESSSSSSSSDDELDDGDEAELDDEIDFDPYGPDNIPETTQFYPYPTLDLKSYTNAKEIIDDDYVMDSWAEQWGPKLSRKKNRKQSILQEEYQNMRKQQREYLSINSRFPDPNEEEKEGYTWTLTEDKGWKLSLNGDAPGVEYETKIVQIAKKDPIMTGCHYLFEIKNPGLKTFSRSYGGRSYLSKSHEILNFWFIHPQRVLHLPFFFTLLYRLLSYPQNECSP
jgi:hypothetical protein